MIRESYKEFCNLRQPQHPVNNDAPLTQQTELTHLKTESHSTLLRIFTASYYVWNVIILPITVTDITDLVSQGLKRVTSRNSKSVSTIVMVAHICILF